jgi:hypothetical protein
MTGLAKQFGTIIIQQGLQISDENADKLSAEVRETIQVIKEARSDGELSFDEITEIMRELAEDVGACLQSYVTMTSDQFVIILVKLFKEIYYNSEALDNPDIPYVPEWIEKNMEAALFDYIMPVVARTLATVFF